MRLFKNEKKIIKISITIFFLFITLVFLIGLNKSSIYDTKDLVGKQLENIKLDNFNENKILTESDLRKNDFTLIIFGHRGADHVERTSNFIKIK